MNRSIACLVLLLAAPSLAADYWQADQQIPITGAADPKLEAFDKLMSDFLREHQVPGASLAIARNGKIVYARGFGYADVAKKQPVQPDSLFRIASVSKSFTSAAVMQLVEQGKLKLDEPAFAKLKIEPHLESGATPDPRLKQITIAQLLHHTGGFDRGASFDPMFRPLVIAKETATPPPANPHAIISYMMGRKLDFDPGTKEAYSNFGYCVLGRLIEQTTGMSYENYVRKEVLTPLGIKRMQIGHSLAEGRAAGEVVYYSRNPRIVSSIFNEQKKVPQQYGGWNLEAMDSHGGWIASAPELVRFASSLDDPAHSPILKRESVETLFARPKDTGFTADGKEKPAYYACGWMVRPVGNSGKANTWHNGLLDGTSTLLVRRSDGLSWAVLFNCDRDPKGTTLSNLIDPLVHPVASGIKDWPTGLEFKE
jgi:N-acyl-D-amino-acid deacylase